MNEAERVAAGLTHARASALLDACDHICSDDDALMDGAHQRNERDGLCSISTWKGGWRINPTPLGQSIATILKEQERE